MSEEKKSYPAGTHPNSLAALGRAWTSEDAKAAQLLGAAKKKANRLARDQLKLTMQAWKEFQDTIKEEDMSSIDMLKVLMFQALDDNDNDTAIDIAKSLAEFERPKLARIEQKVESVNADDLTDDELDAKLKEFLKK